MDVIVGSVARWSRPTLILVIVLTEASPSSFLLNTLIQCVCDLVGWSATLLLTYYAILHACAIFTVVSLALFQFIPRCERTDLGHLATLVVGTKLS
jgi:hypothetical protein